MSYVRWFDEITINDIGAFGGKNASLGEMIRHLTSKQIAIPSGFALSAKAYFLHIEKNQLRSKIEAALQKLESSSYQAKELQQTSKTIRALIEQAKLPEEVAKKLEEAYKKLSKNYGTAFCTVAVRSSATAEDLPTASFAGQQETFLGISGTSELLEATVRCMSSLFTERALIYRHRNKFDHMAVGLSVGVQKLVRSDLEDGSSGVAFSLDTETGFPDVITIEGSWGIGEAIVQGIVTPDFFVVHKRLLKDGFDPIIRQRRGAKEVKIVLRGQKTVEEQTQAEQRRQFVLTREQVCELACMVALIEDHYSKIRQQWCPMDVEWAYDGVEKKMYIVQARPETVFSQNKKATVTRFLVSISSDVKPILTGQSIGSKAVVGRVRLIQKMTSGVVLNFGEILVTKMTDPDFLPLIKNAAGIITEQGGRTCHAAIVSRELGLPAIVGVSNALSELQDGEVVTIDCTTGMVGKIYHGEQKIRKEEIVIGKKIEFPVPIFLNAADPDQVFSLALLRTSGVGLARIEFIIAHRIGVHPRACVEYKTVPKQLSEKILERIEIPNQKPTEFFIDTLARSIAQIAASFHPRPVFVRLSDFKSNEYRNLIGGELFEPTESNPMLGLRGASRYCHPEYQEAFFLECAAIEYAFTKMGCDNIHLLIPFVRTVVEAREVIALLKSRMPAVAQKKMPICMMVELPSNIFDFEQFAPLFDSFSIGSNDLLQFTFGVDRDSAFFAEKITEQDPVFLSVLQGLLLRAKKAGKKIGICGQAPSDFPSVAEFLIKHGISYLSLNPDSVFTIFTKK